MLDIVRYLVDWPRDSKGEVIFTNSHEAIFYAIMVQQCKELIKEIEVLRYLSQKRLYLELNKPDSDLDLVIKLAAKHSFYSQCIETAQILFREEGR